MSKENIQSLDEYQERILGFMNPKTMEKKEDILLNAVLGLCGETGELVDHIKKWMYHGHELDFEHIKRELGDIKFYSSLADTALDAKSSEIAQMNIDKLTKRYPDGKFTIEASKAKADQQ